MSLDPEVLKQIAVGDKVEVHDTKNDRVTQGWVEKIHVWPSVEKHAQGKNAGEYCYGEIVFKGDNDGYAYHIFVSDEVRILVKTPVLPKVGDKVRRPFASDYPIGTILSNSDGFTWIVLSRNNDTGIPLRRFVGMTAYNRTHLFLTGLYRIESIENE